MPPILKIAVLVALGLLFPCALLIVLGGVRAPLWVVDREVTATGHDRFLTPEAALGIAWPAEAVADPGSYRGVVAGIQALYHDDTRVVLLKSEIPPLQSAEYFIVHALIKPPGSMTASGSGDDISFRLAAGIAGRAVAAEDLALLVFGPSPEGVEAHLASTPALHRNPAQNWANRVLDDHTAALLSAIALYLAALAAVAFRLWRRA